MTAQQTDSPESAKNKKGFTLIELSIVLVIIGLIVGGVLVGQDLIKAAEIRATIGQIEKYNTAVNTFRTKFNGMPGDIQGAAASSFGLATRTGGTGRGDGNSLIDGSVAGAVWSQEAGLFWVDMGSANLVDGSFTTAADAAAPAVISGAATVPSYLPLAKLGRGNFITVGAASGLNYYWIGGVTSATAAGEITASMSITPLEAFNMDNKLDDGAPNTGIVQAHGTTANVTTQLTIAPSFNASANSGSCVVGTGTATTDTYQRSVTASNSPGTTPACAVRFRFN
jgi:prepilin-type N-terminal cleavage/methylation domain-containing protein